MTSDVLRIGSRGSDLALWQARWVRDQLLLRFPALEILLTIIKTKGDKILDAPLSKIGDKGLFTREIEHALLAGEIDLAVHSLKDLPTELPEGLTIGAVCEREDVRDVFIPHPSNKNSRLLDQPQGARIVTGSLRRRCQLLNLRPDFTIIDVRGNLNTRLQKLDTSEWAGMILARAGVVRLGWEARIGETIPGEMLLPAVGQGALGVEIREGDAHCSSLVGALSHVPTTQATAAERALLRTLEGGCQVPIGALGRVVPGGGKGRLVLDALVGSLDGRIIVRDRIEGAPEAAGAIGIELATTLLRKGADVILRDIRSSAIEPHATAE
jgi:hydroxymethylbilane synthase